MKDNIIEFLEWVSAHGKVDLVDISYLVDGEYYSQLPWEIKMNIVDQFLQEKQIKENKTCPYKINGVCQNHNLQCGYPKCEGR